MIASLAAAEVATADNFKGAFRHHPGGVALITAAGESGMAALTATSVSSVSVDPQLLVFSVSDASSTAAVLNTADSVVVHLLDEQSLHLAKLGATSGIDRFADTSAWRLLPTGEPVFHDSPVWIRGQVMHRLTTGTATLTVVEARTVFVDEQTATGTRPGLVHHDRIWHRIGGSSRIEENSSRHH